MNAILHQANLQSLTEKKQRMHISYQGRNRNEEILPYLPIFSSSAKRLVTKTEARALASSLCSRISHRQTNKSFSRGGEDTRTRNLFAEAAREEITFSSLARTDKLRRLDPKNFVVCRRNGSKSQAKQKKPVSSRSNVCRYGAFDLL